MALHLRDLCSVSVANGCRSDANSCRRMMLSAVSSFRRRVSYACRAAAP